MNRTLIAAFACVTLATVPTRAQAPCSGSPSQVEACEHAQQSQRQAQRAADKAQQLAAGDAEQARFQAAEDAALAPLRARIGPGFGGAPCFDVSKTSAARASISTAPFETDPPVAEHDTLPEVAADRADSARLRVAFDALRCFALHRTGEAVDPAKVQRDPSGMGAPFTFYQRIVAKVPDLEPKLRAALVRREAQDVIDEKCIAVPACMAKRFTDRAARAACGFVAMHAAAQAAIATERKYGAQSGVVDLVKLHDLGDELRISDEQLAVASARYAELAKKPFSTSLCGQ